MVYKIYLQYLILVKTFQLATYFALNSSDEFGVSQDTSRTLMLKIDDNLYSKLSVAKSLDTFYASGHILCIRDL